jgi:hypothetical protein
MSLLTTGERDPRQQNSVTETKNLKNSSHFPCMDDVTVQRTTAIEIDVYLTEGRTSLANGSPAQRI